MSVTETKRLLQEFYNLTSEDIPQKREFSEWESENKFGFLLGTIAYGNEAHITELYNLLLGKEFQVQEQTFIDSMFDFYIWPFHRSYNTDTESLHSRSTISPRASRNNSAEDMDYASEERELNHNDLKKAVLKRDGVCLFCWESELPQAAHIIAQKNISFAYDESCILQRAGLTQIHQVQNGLLLCSNCHLQFDKLMRYVDVVDDKLVVKVVNQSNDKTSEKHRDWERAIRGQKVARFGREEDWTDIDSRNAVESNGEMALYFIEINHTILPSREALEFHKAACLIWRMAGGAEPDDECCSDCDSGPVSTSALRKRFKLPAEDSSSTLNPDAESLTNLNQIA